MFAHSRIQIDYGFVNTGSEWGANGITIGNKNREGRSRKETLLRGKWKPKWGKKQAVKLSPLPSNKKVRK